MTEGREMAKMKRTEVLLARRIRATRDSCKIGALIELLNQQWFSDPDMGLYAWVIYKNDRGYMYMRVYQPGCTRLGAILMAVSTVKMGGYVCAYDEKADYLTLRIFS